MVIVLSGSRRFVLIVEVAEATMVMSGVELTLLVGREDDWAFKNTLGENFTDQKRLRVVQPAISGRRRAGGWSVAAPLGRFSR